MSNIDRQRISTFTDLTFVELLMRLPSTYPKLR